MFQQASHDIIDFSKMPQKPGQVSEGMINFDFNKEGENGDINILQKYMRESEGGLNKSSLTKSKTSVASFHTAK
jgi:hypothetical protein